MAISEGELASIALCWTVERADGAGMALTSHDTAIGREGLKFEPSPSLTPASITRGGATAPVDTELAGSLDTDALTEEDLTLGRWNGSRVELIALDWADPEGESIPLLTGRLGEVTVQGGQFTAELRGAAAQLSRPACPFTSPECRAELGDKACRVDLASRTRRVRVVANSGHDVLLDSPIDDRFLLGRLRYLSGDNSGVVTTLLSVEGASVRLRDLPRGRLETGAIVELREGCDKRLQTCSERFGNAVNFRGEPHLPGNDLLTRYPGS